MELVYKIFHQLSWQFGAKVVSALSTVVLLSLITRFFGESGTGVYTLAFTYLAFFYLAVDFGLNGYFLSFYNEDKDLPNKLFNFRLWWSVLLFVVSCFILPLLPFATTEFIVTVLIGAFTIVLNGIFNSTNFIFQNQHIMFMREFSLAFFTMIIIRTNNALESFADYRSFTTFVTSYKLVNSFIDSIWFGFNFWLFTRWF